MTARTLPSGFVRTEMVGQVGSVGHPIGIITLDRPDKRNALTPAMLDDLRTAAANLDGSSRALVLRGEGSVFCAGFDLTMCAEHPDGSVMRDLLTRLDALIRTLRALPIGVVASVRGAAVAGGCAMLGGCDLVIAEPKAKLGYPVVRIGVSPAVSAPTLSARISLGAARSRLLDPGLIDASRAQELGLVDTVTDDPDAAARQQAERFAAKPPIAFARTKSWLNELTNSETSAGVDAGVALGRSLALTGGDEERLLLPLALHPVK